LFQCVLTLSAHMGEQPKLRSLPTKADDPTVILSAIAEFGWDLVTAAPITFPDSTAVTCIYVFRRAGR
jgi:hypothetical protein